MNINERFDFIIKALFAGNKRAFAKAVSISPTVVENIVGKRKGKPSFDVLVRVCSNANISAEWLLLGIGENFTDAFELRKVPLQLSSKDIPDGEFESDDILDENDNNVEENELIKHLKEEIREEKAENKKLYEEIGALKERLKAYETPKNSSSMSKPQLETETATLSST